MFGTYRCQGRKLLALGSLLLAGSLAQAQLSGAIFTTLSDGTTVNANIYDAKEDVYLNGGPQNQNASGLPDGIYFFQVTDPSGKTLLSTTNAMDRLEKVTNGRFAGRCDSNGNLLPDPVSPHPNGTLDPASGSLPVQLFPYDDTPNNGGEYKAWVILRQFDGDSKIYGTPAEDGVHIDFLSRYAKTDNFKVKITTPPLQGSLSGRKFFDLNSNGNDDNFTDPPIAGFVIQITLNGSDVHYVTTDSNGFWQYGPVDGGTTYDVCEILPPDQQYNGVNASTKWIQTAPGTMNDPEEARCYEGTVNGDQGGLDFGNTQVISLNGEKFYDSNLDGKPAGDAGISGWKIDYTITDPDGTVEPMQTITTDANGQFSIPNIPIGASYSISEEQGGSNWKQTAPAGNLLAFGPITVTPQASYDVTFNQPDINDLDFGNILQASLSGTKFYDKNINGSKDGGEQGLQGFTVNITGKTPDGNTYNDSKTTDNQGNYSFGPYPDGTTYDITETVPTGWQQTTQVHITGTITASGPITSSSTLDDVTGLNIGNILVAKLKGTKFYDRNLNGQQDANDPGIPGFSISNAWTKPDGSTGTDTTTTDASGNYSFGPYPDGTTYSITETLPTGWKQTTSSPITGTLHTNGSLDSTSTLPDVTGLNIGNILTAKLKGTKFDDHNMNGTKDANDEGIQGITINISGTTPDGNHFTDSTTTDASGNYSFGPYPDGTTYDITETVPAGYIQTTPVHITGTLSYGGTITVNSVLNDVTGLNIGNIPVFNLSGLKWYDTNTNGVKDGGEPTIKGFKIVITWTKPNNTTGTTTVYTDASGNWTAGPYPAGTTYKVTEVAPPGNWHESYPAAPGYYTGTLNSNVSGLAFGNFLTGGGNGLTPGYWSNTNGYNSANAIGWTTVMNKLNSSNLRNLNGTIQTWAVSANGYKSFQTWMGAGTNASNMATQLSVHLAAFELNVMSSKIPGSTLIYAPGSTSANALGYATANALIAEAITELGLHGLTVQASATRTYQEALKNAFANANMQVGSSTVLPPVTVIVPSPY